MKLKFVHATPNYRIGLYYIILRKFSPWNPHLLLCDLWYFENFLWLNFYLPVCMKFTVILTSHSAAEFVQATKREYCQSEHLPQWLWTGADRPRGERRTLRTTQSRQRRRGGGVFWWGAWLLHGEAQKLPTKSTKVSKTHGHGHNWQSWWSSACNYVWITICSCWHPQVPLSFIQNWELGEKAK